MDDILLAGSDPQATMLCCNQVIRAFTQSGFQIAPEKIQIDFYKKTQLKITSLKTMNDFQQLLGHITWLSPYLKLAKGDLMPLYDLLCGNADPSSPQSLTPAARESLVLIEKAIEGQFVCSLDYQSPFHLLIFATSHSPTCLICQENHVSWIHLHATPKKVLAPYYLCLLYTSPSPRD